MTCSYIYLSDYAWFLIILSKCVLSVGGNIQLSNGVVLCMSLSKSQNTSSSEDAQPCLVFLYLPKVVIIEFNAHTINTDQTGPLAKRMEYLSGHNTNSTWYFAYMGFEN